MGKPGFDQQSLKNTNLSFNFHLIGEIVIRKIWYRGSKHRFIMRRKHSSLRRRLGSVGLCRHNFEHNTMYIWSIKHNAGIILIFLQHNAVISENYEKCLKILPATRSRKSEFLAHQMQIIK